MSKVCVLSLLENIRMRSRESKLPVFSIGYQNCCRTLHSHRAIKNDGARQDSLESTSLHQDELIPNVRKKRKVQMTEEDPIDWNAPL